MQVVDPVTGQPFPGNVIPADRITPQAASLLGYYPRPNAVGIGANYQTPIIVKTRQDSGQTRLTHQFRNGREQFQGAFQYQRTTIESANLFSFVDTTQTTGLNVDINHSHRLNQFMFLRSRYQGGRQTNDVTPSFAERHQRVGERRHPRQRSEPGQLGAAGAQLLERHRRPRHRAVRREHQPTPTEHRPSCSGFAAATA